jgi:uncharacterized protein (TIGR01370 family)
MKIKKISYSILLVSLMATSSFGSNNIDKYKDKLVKILNKKIEYSVKKQDNLFKKVRKLEKQADSYDLNINAYEYAIDCTEDSDTKTKVKECYSELKKDLKSIKSGEYELKTYKNTEENEDNGDSASLSNEDMLYVLGANIDTIDLSKFDFKYITVDLEDTSEEAIESLHNDSKNVICYLSVGTYEDWRSDKDKFPEEAIGKPLGDWEGENWLDIRNDDIVSIMEERIDLAYEKGCDGVDFDNIDGYTNDTGFKLTKEDQVNYLKEISSYARSQNLTTTLKNGMLMIPELMDYFDIALNESCHVYNECNLYEDWLNNGKVVYNIEYKDLDSDKVYRNDNFHTYVMDRNLKGKTYIKK